MRISLVSLLLLGTALAVPISKVDQRGKTAQDSLVSRGLAPIIPRVAPITPKVIVPKPVKPIAPPKPITPPKPVEPPRPIEPPTLNPHGPQTPTPVEPLNPAEPARPPPATQGGTDAPLDRLDESNPTSKNPNKPDGPLGPDPPATKPPPRLTGGACPARRDGITKRCGGGTGVPIAPTKEEIKLMVHVEPGTSLFYSGPDGYAGAAETWRSRNAPNYKVYKEMFTDKSWEANMVKSEKYYWDFTCDGEPPQMFTDKSWEANMVKSEKYYWDFTHRSSEALAEESAGRVFVLLPADTTGRSWLHGTVWDTHEWPALQANHRVTEVIRVNPENNLHQVIWPTVGTPTPVTAPLPASP